MRRLDHVTGVARDPCPPYRRRVKPILVNSHLLSQSRSHHRLRRQAWEALALVVKCGRLPAMIRRCGSGLRLPAAGDVERGAELPEGPSRIRGMARPA